MGATKELIRRERLPKPKLPRKRKKAAIKAQGRKWYYDTIQLWKNTQDDPRLFEKRCKFWRNDSIKTNFIQLPNGSVFPVPTPTRFW